MKARPRLVPALLCAVAALLAVNLFRAAEPSADAQPVRFNPYLGVTVDGTSSILFRITNTGEVEAYDTFNLLDRPVRWVGWRRLP